MSAFCGVIRSRHNIWLNHCTYQIIQEKETGLIPQGNGDRLFIIDESTRWTAKQCPGPKILAAGMLQGTMNMGKVYVDIL